MIREHFSTSFYLEPNGLEMAWLVGMSYSFPNGNKIQRDCRRMQRLVRPFLVEA